MCELNLGRYSKEVLLFVVGGSMAAWIGERLFQGMFTRDSYLQVGTYLLQRNKLWWLCTLLAEDLPLGVQRSLT